MNNKKIIEEFKKKIIRELKMVGFKKWEAEMILKIHSLPLIDVLSQQKKEFKKMIEESSITECDTCHGYGFIWKDKESCEKGEKADYLCPTCKGSGKIFNQALINLLNKLK